LNNCEILGNQLLVQHSKHHEVKLPREDQVDEWTKDFNGSNQLQRYKGRPVSMANINKPSQVLHVANLHEGATEEDLKTLLNTDVVQFFTNDRRFAYVGLDSVETAVNAIMKSHNHTLGPYPIRLSFTKKDYNKLVADIESKKAAASESVEAQPTPMVTADVTPAVEEKTEGEQ